MHDHRERDRHLGLSGARQTLPLPVPRPISTPLEKVWSKVKASLRATEARTLAELERAIDAALQSVTTQDAHGWFQSCGCNLSSNALALGKIPRHAAHSAIKVTGPTKPLGSSGEFAFSAGEVSDVSRFSDGKLWSPMIRFAQGVVTSISS